VVCTTPAPVEVVREQSAALDVVAQAAQVWD
jgi:hypothetical protein